jgi:predicted unusual protein kinase regulating ubiquinone biosynthesis (AarF/ABC1/UbiB family)
MPTGPSEALAVLAGARCLCHAPPGLRPRRRPLAPGGTARVASVHMASRIRRRLGRALRLASTSARAGAGWAAAALLDGVGGTRGARAVVRATSEGAAAALGRMKGLAMKVGQMVSFALPDLPPEVAEPLAALQIGSAPRPFAEIARVLEAELGRPVDVAFRDFERTPVAAASIGQVHRAWLPDGAAVAVKVQYPDVAEAVHADLANAAGLARALRLLLPGLDAEAVAAELRERILDELDYREEARRQGEFAARFAGHPFVAVPAVFPSHSAARVLTTAWAPGRPFAEVLRDPEPVRARHAEILLRWILGCVLRDGAFVADPHPGNQRFDAEGARTAFLDYGCVKRLAAPTLAALRALFRAGLDGDRAAVRGAAEALGVVVAGRDADAVARGLAHLYVPFARDATERFPRVVSAPAVRDALGAGLAEVRTALRIPGELPFLNRTVIGTWSVLARLGAAGPWHRIAREYAFGEAPATLLGEAEAAWLAVRSGG